MVKWIALAALALVIVGVAAFPRIGRSPAAFGAAGGRRSGAGPQLLYCRR